MKYARSFLNEINFTIPDGYSDGLEALNKEVKNNTGGFISLNSKNWKETF